MTAYVRQPGDFSDAAYLAAFKADKLALEKKLRRERGELSPMSPAPPLPSPTSPSGRLTMKDLDIKVEMIDKRLRRVETKLNQVLRQGVKVPVEVSSSSCPPVAERRARSPMKDYLDAFLEPGMPSPSRRIPNSVFAKLAGIKKSPVGGGIPSKRSVAAPKRKPQSPKVKPETAAARKRREAEESRQAAILAQEAAKKTAADKAKFISDWKKAMDQNEDYIKKVQEIIDTEGFSSPFFIMGEYVPEPILEKYAWDRTMTGHLPQFKNYKWY